MELKQQFEQWAKDNIEMELGETWVAIDGKSINMGRHDSDYHSFVSMVSVYRQQQGVVLATQAFERSERCQMGSIKPSPPLSKSASWTN